MRSRFSKKEAAQTAIEVAVFGAILLFVLSIIVRQAFSSNFGQNQTLRVVRMAMTASYNTSLAGSPARNNATVIVVEDHLNPSLNKFGPEARTPFILSGSATHSRQLFQPPSYGVVTELPRLDIFVNGQHFQFTLSGYKLMTELDCRYIGCGVGGTEYPDWDNNCAYRNVWNGSNYGTIQWVGCRRFYKVATNYMRDMTKNQFCCDDQPACGGSCGGSRCCDTAKNLPAAQRFDLNRTAPGGAVPSSLWEDFSWQWYMIKGFSEEMSRSMGAGFNGPEVIPYIVNYGDTIIWTEQRKDNILLDMDGDFKEESILGGGGTRFNSTGVLQSAEILDPQEGDIDFTRGTNEPGPRPGLKEDMKMYTFERDTSSPDGGMYLLIEEGRLMNPLDGGQFVRSVQKRDRVDLVERVIQLSRDTGRYCDWGTNSPKVPVDALMPVNPVESCDDNCFRSTNIYKTCFDRTYNIIYVRSRLRDLGGKKWITPVIP